MRIELGSTEYEFGWQHANPVTVCTVAVKPDGGQPSSMAASAVKGKRDQFCRDIGRKVSLGRLLHQLFPADKANRKQVWDLYFSRLPENKRPGCVA